MRRRDRPERPEDQPPTPEEVIKAMPRADRPSRTQMKQQAQAAQDLGRDLSELNADQLSRIDMTDALRDALVEFKRTKSHEGRRRQLQLVGKCMRQADIEPLRQAVAAIKLGHAQDSLALHQAEYWREVLVAEDAAITRFVQEHEGVDVQALRQLVRRARTERTVQTALPTGDARQGRAWRELFKFLRPHLAS